MDDPIARMFRTNPNPVTATVPKTRSAATTTPLDKPYSISRSDTITINRYNMSRIAEKLPFSYIANGRFSDKDISEATKKDGPREWTEQALAQTSITERNYALAATTPVLGQYAPTFDA